MEKRNWKRSVTLKQRMVLCLAAFFAAFALQLALNGYQARAVQQVQDDQMGNFNAISRFQGGVESSISILEAYRWENGETEEMLEKLRAACSTSNAWLWRIRSNMDGLQNVSDEQWVLYGAVETTYGSPARVPEETNHERFQLIPFQPPGWCCHQRPHRQRSAGGTGGLPFQRAGCKGIPAVL